MDSLISSSFSFVFASLNFFKGFIHLLFKNLNNLHEVGFKVLFLVLLLCSNIQGYLGLGGDILLGCS